MNPHREPTRSAHPHREGDRECVFGLNPVRELLAAAPEAVRAICIKRGDLRRFAREIELARRVGAEIREVDDPTLARAAGADARHQGIVALTRPYAYAPLDDVLAMRPDPLLVIDGVTDPRNLGAILRSAEGAGAGALVIARDRTAPITPAAIKASAGAWAHLKVARCGNVARFLADLKEAGYWIAALAPGSQTSLYEVDTSRRLAIVIGSEGEGVRSLVKKTADFVVSIPMRGRVASLNVSVATAVALFEIARHRSATTQ
jgi:23S rRNA (guanosine2251-2'-O)-methyltransferase